MAEHDFARSLRPLELRIRQLERSLHELQLSGKHTQKIMMKLENHLTNFDHKVEDVYNIVNETIRYE